MSKEDARIVETVLEGQSDSYGVLVEKYAELLYKYFIMMLSPGDQRIEDLCQETFLAGFAGLASLSNRENFKGWLFGIASNKLKTEFRNRKKDRQMAESLSEAEKVAVGDLKQELEQEQVRALVQKGLGTLPEEMKEVITLKYFGNLSYEEIAEVLEVPKSTVRGRMYRAYQALRIVFKKDA